jgi:hypothetical protein
VQPIGFAKFIFKWNYFARQLGLLGEVGLGRKDKTALYVRPPTDIQ